MSRIYIIRQRHSDQLSEASLAAELAARDGHRVDRAIAAMPDNLPPLVYPPLLNGIALTFFHAAPSAINLRSVRASFSLHPQPTEYNQ